MMQNSGMGEIRNPGPSGGVTYVKCAYFLPFF